MKDILVCPVCDGTTFSEFIQTKDYTVSHETFSLKKCSACGFTLTSPVPTNLDPYYISDAYISHASKASTLMDRIYLLARKFTLRWKTNLVRSYTTGKVSLLDIGCGTGEFLKQSHSLGWEVAGMEPSEKARQNIPAAILNNVAPSLDTLPEKTYNAITLWHVLEHIPELNETIRTLKGKLADSGTIFIAVPNYKSADAQRYTTHWAAYDVPRHLWHFSKDTLERLFKRNGLKLHHVLPMKLDAYYVSLLSERYAHGNKTTVFTMLRAIVNGLSSNLKAKKNKEYSSLIYIFRK